MSRSDIAVRCIYEQPASTQVMKYTEYYICIDVYYMYITTWNI